MMFVIAALVLAVARPGPPNIHNLMPAFWKAWDAPKSARVAQFKERVVLPALQVYANGEFESNLSDEAIASYLDGLQARAPAMRERSERISAELPGDIARVQEALPDLRLSKIQFYILPSFNHFNGQTSDLGSGIGVFFGVDGVLEFGPRNFGVIVAHELFHIYQYETHPGYNTGDLPLWGAVWGEGSAAYASQQLAKNATMSDALDPELAEASPATVKALACYIQTNWDSHSGSAIENVIDASRHPQGLPARGGYLIGYLAARDFMATHTIAQLGSAPAGAAQAALKGTVERLCL